ncbi:MAG: 2-dehydropantoate 2-reductase [Planctomycetes bacterium]|nr:2-dehydropantoate 2-reductase [Planctomycetota bacterium]
MAARLEASGAEVVLLCREAALARLVEDQGLVLLGPDGERTLHRVRARDLQRSQEAGPCEAVLVCVKARDTESALGQARPLVEGGSPTIITLQNGLGLVDRVAGLVGRARVVAALTREGAAREGPGVVRHAGRGETVVAGAAGCEEPRVGHAAELLTAAGFRVRRSRDLAREVWAKVAVNAGLNAPAALLGVANGALPGSPAWPVCREASLEAARVATASGVPLEGDLVVAHLEEVCRATAGNTCSMAADLEAGRPTEVEVINGAVVDEGSRRGVSTPVNRVLTLLVKARERRDGRPEVASEHGQSG